MSEDRGQRSGKPAKRSVFYYCLFSAPRRLGGSMLPFKLCGGDRSVMMAIMISALTALQRLRDGNHRFVSELGGLGGHTGQSRRSELAGGQEPFAIILGCADSRVPAEIVFDQGLGDLFVIRVAGNIVAPSLIGSVEFSAELHGTRLVVVLGHSQCGAILATLDELERPSQNRSPNLRSIVDRVRPAVQPLFDTRAQYDRAALVNLAVRANIRASVEQLKHGSQVLERLIQKDGLLIVGAEYSLETGEVDFFEGLPEQMPANVQ